MMLILSGVAARTRGGGVVIVRCERLWIMLTPRSRVRSEEGGQQHEGHMQ